VTGPYTARRDTARLETLAASYKDPLERGVNVVSPAGGVTVKRDVASVHVALGFSKAGSCFAAEYSLAL